MGWGEIIENFRREHGYGENAAKPKKRKKEVGENLWKQELDSHEVLSVQGQPVHSDAMAYTQTQNSVRKDVAEVYGEYKEIELPSRAKEVPKSTPTRSPEKCREADKRREATEAKIRANWAEDDANNF